MTLPGILPPDAGRPEAASDRSHEDNDGAEPEREGES